MILATTGVLFATCPNFHLPFCITLSKFLLWTNHIAVSPLHFVNRLFSFRLSAFFLPCPNHIFKKIISSNCLLFIISPRNFFGGRFFYQNFYFLISILLPIYFPQDFSPVQFPFHFFFFPISFKTLRTV